MKKTLLFITFVLIALPALAREAPAEAATSDVRIKIELDQDIHPADTPSTAVIKVAVKAPPANAGVRRNPVNLSIVLDRSGSMHGDKIEYARLAAIEALGRLHPDDVFSLVTYDSTIETVIPAQKVRNLEAAESLIRAITPRGMTALHGGVNQGASEIRKHLDGAYAHRILLLSDGIANVGPSSPVELERLGRALARENIAVTTIGVGLDYNEDLMTRLARASDGNTYFVEASRDLPRILGVELGDVINVFARRAVIRVEFDENIRPLAILGREGVIRDRTVEIPLHQLYGGQERFALIEVELPPVPAGGRQKVGSAELHYEEIANRRTRSVRSGDARILFSGDDREITASANPVVQEQVLEVRAAAARESAIELADRGLREEAAQQLRAVGLLYRDVADRHDNPALAARAQEVGAEADLVETRGIDNVQRKAYRAANQQTVNQQTSP